MGNKRFLPTFADFKESDIESFLIYASSLFIFKTKKEAVSASFFLWLFLKHSAIYCINTPLNRIFK